MNTQPLPTQISLIHFINVEHGSLISTEISDITPEDCRVLLTLPLNHQEEGDRGLAEFLAADEALLRGDSEDFEEFRSPGFAIREILSTALKSAVLLGQQGQNLESLGINDEAFDGMIEGELYELDEDLLKIFSDKSSVKLSLRNLLRGTYEAGLEIGQKEPNLQV